MKEEQRINDIWNPTGDAIAAISSEKPDKSGKIPFFPYCENRFKAVCRIGKQPRPCSRCPDSERKPVSPDMIKKNMNGQKAYLGIYPLLDGDVTAWVAGDFDCHNDRQQPDEDIRRVVNFLNEINQYHDIPFYLFSSKSGKGYHLYLFSDKPIPSGKFRIFYNEIMKRSEVGISFDSVYPKQDHIMGLDIGNLIAMPFHGQSFKKKGGCWLDASSFDVLGSSVIENVQCFLEEFEPVKEQEIDNILKEWGLKYNPGENISGTHKAPADTSEKISNIIDSCAFLSHCRDNAASLSEPHWFMMIQVLAREYGGPGMIHSLSKDYPGYNPEETDRKILNVLNNQPAPLTCRFIKTSDSGFNCGKDCGVTSPIQLVAGTQNNANQNEIEWVSEVLIGVGKGERQISAKRLAGFWFKQYSGDKDKTYKALADWNTRNNPPLDDGFIKKIIDESHKRRGLDLFGNATGLSIMHLERLEYPDGSVLYQIYTENNKPYIFTIPQLAGREKFQHRVIEIGNFMPPVPTGKGAQEAWRTLLNSLLQDADTIVMPEEETPNSIIRGMIQSDIETFIKDSGNDNFDISLAAEYGAILYKENVFVVLTSLMTRTKIHDELKQYNRKEIATFLKSIGFVYTDKARSVKGDKKRKFWEISLSDFKKTQ